MHTPRRFTLFLLLALWLNACLGWSLHEAEHLRHALAPSTQAAVQEGAALAAPPSAPANSPAEHKGSPGGHGLCIGCLAFAHLHGAAPPPVPALPWAEATPALPWAEATPALACPAARQAPDCASDAPRPFSARGPPPARFL
ncbi:hypothetical protein [Paracidovorax konjaci]|uniref:DUF2946 domain-containing protein n=1 Tax=Paracidovorax konjaci TaxID=32040 RepID=A0A1I1SDD9_9BURK|nr:hypothetical protein [Paracidovorax konjaci]SFD44496.1 hypothetical protein SAMN04489710_102138 [Paracidovorax konjaci]